MKRWGYLVVLVIGVAGCTPALMKASKKGNLMQVQKLIDQGADVTEVSNNFDSMGHSTALNYAVEYGHIGVVQALLKAGADPNLDTRTRMTRGASPLFFAIQLGHSKIAEILLDAGADPNRPYSVGPSKRLSPLHHAMSVGNELIQQLLLEKGAMRANVQTPPARRRGTLFTQKTAAAPQPVAAPSYVPARVAAPIVSPIQAPNYQASERRDDFAVIVGIDDYKDLPNATFAERDTKAVAAHMRALGVPQRHIIHLSGSNATYTSIKKYLDSWLPRNVKPTSRVFFYFSGHGAPDTKTGAAYLVPYDGDPTFLQDTAYPIKGLYGGLSKLNAKEIIVALDTCFSGAGGRSVLGEGLRPLITEVDTGTISDDRITVLTAAAGNEVTSTLKDEGHGLFTYFLLKGLNGSAKDAQGHITAKGLYHYLKPHVQDEARLQNREQTPTFRSGSGAIGLR